MLNRIYRFFCPAKNPEIVRHDYGIPEKIEFKFELRPDGWLVLTSEQLPGLITEGRDPQELLEMFNDAVLTYFDVPKSESDIVFPSINLTGIGEVSYKNAGVRCAA